MVNFFFFDHVNILRNTYEIELSETDKIFVREWARTDFKKYKNEIKKDKINNLLTQGKSQLRVFENGLMLARANK
jgi:hypothetical protein